MTAALHGARCPELPMPTIDKNSASARLLGRLLEGGDASVRSLAAALGVTPERVEDFLAMRERMPLALQVRLALVVETDVPRLAREARRLRSQAIAAAAMSNGTTICHARPPEGWR